MSEENVHLPEWTLWTGADHSELVQAVSESLTGQVRLLSVGGPRHARVTALACALGHEVCDDLRATLNDLPPAFVLVGAGASISVADWQAMEEHQTRVLALDPPVAGLEDLNALLGKAGRQGDGPSPFESRLHFLPGFIHSPGLDAATEAIANLGKLDASHWHWTGAAKSMRLFARLYDAWQTLLSFFEMPETITASFAGQGLEQDSLRRMHGSLAMVARYPNMPAMSILVSDAGTRERRSWQLLGEQGELLIRDDGFEYYDTAGELLDQSLGMVDATKIESLVVQQIEQVLARHTSDAAPSPTHARLSQIMACCIASQLSARTGEAEQPERLLRML